MPNNNLTVVKKVVNQKGQYITFLAANSELEQIIARIDGYYFNTGFYDCDDFCADSEYLPILLDDNRAILFYDLYEA